MKDKYDTTTRDWVDSEEAPEAELDFDAADPTNTTIDQKINAAIKGDRP